MARITRKELKTDKFALEVQHSVEYVSQHRQQLIRWGGVGVAVVILAAAFFIYRNHERNVRQEALHQAIQIQNANVGQQASEFLLTFPSEAERQKAAVKAFTEVANKYPGTQEGGLAEFFLGTNLADSGNYAEAEKHFQKAMSATDQNFNSLIKLSLAKVYASEGKLGEGEKLIQSMIDKPTALVSKDQATLALGQLIAPTDPQRARKLIEPLRSSPRGAISRAAITAAAELPLQK